MAPKPHFTSATGVGVDLDREGLFNNENEPRDVLGDDLIDDEDDILRRSIPSSRGSYRYKPLFGNKAFRLLEIKPAKSSVICSLRDAYLGGSSSSTSPDYLTLSYCWDPIEPDDGHLTKYVTCDGFQIPVTANLYAALRRVRHLLDTGWCEGLFNRRLLIWVDAICINQADLTERARQVELMAEIYQRCSRLLIWLGEMPMDGRSDIRELFDRSSEDYQGLAVRHGSGDARIQRGCELVCSMPWFSRRWIIQEVLKTDPESRYFMLGDRTIKMTGLVRVANILEAHRNVLPPQIIRASFLGIGVDRSSVEFGEYNRSLLARLCLFDDAECSLPHDRVYALRDISDDAQGITVDYRRPCSQFYRSIARRFLLQGYLVQTLICASVKRYRDARKDDTTPSWVPNWHSPSTFASKDHERTAAGLFDNFIMHPPREEHKASISVKGSILQLQVWLMDPSIPDDSHSSESCLHCQLLHPEQGDDVWTTHTSEKQRRELTKQYLLAKKNSHVIAFLEGCELGWFLSIKSGELKEGLDALDRLAYHLESCFKVQMTAFTKQILTDKSFSTKIRIA